MKILAGLALVAALIAGSTIPALAQDHAPQNPAVKSPNVTSQAPLAQGQNSFTKAQARGRIKKAGYTDVTDLTLDANGLWQASAKQDGKSVHVALDYKGDVAPQ